MGIMDKKKESQFPKVIEEQVGQKSLYRGLTSAKNIHVASSCSSSVGASGSPKHCEFGGCCPTGPANRTVRGAFPCVCGDPIQNLRQQC